MAGETTQSSPWLELISDVRLKNPMHTHKHSEPLHFLLISFWCFLPQIPFLSEAERAAVPVPGERLCPSVAAEPGEGGGSLDVGQAERRVKNGQCWTTINGDYDFF